MFHLHAVPIKGALVMQNPTEKVDHTYPHIKIRPCYFILTDISEPRPQKKEGEYPVDNNVLSEFGMKSAVHTLLETQAAKIPLQDGFFATEEMLTNVFEGLTEIKKEGALSIVDKVAKFNDLALALKDPRRMKLKLYPTKVEITDFMRDTIIEYLIQQMETMVQGVLEGNYNVRKNTEKYIRNANIYLYNPYAERISSFYTIAVRELNIAKSKNKPDVSQLIEIIQLFKGNAK